MAEGAILGTFCEMPTEYDNFRQMRYDKIFIIMKEKVAYMEKMDKAMEGVLEYLKRKGKLTELENDILLATQICQSSPFDSQAAKKKIMEFNAKYREVCSSILATPGIKTKPLFDMKDEEVWESLWIQVEALCGRELGEIERGESGGEEGKM